MQHQLMTEPAPADPNPPIEPECQCQDLERCPVHHGYDD